MKIVFCDNADEKIVEHSIDDRLVITFPDEEAGSYFGIGTPGHGIAHIDGVNPGLWVEGAPSGHTVGGMGLRDDVGSIEIVNRSTGLVSLVETGSSFDNLFAFGDDEAADRFIALRQSSEDVNHGSTPILDSAFVAAAARDEEEFSVYFDERDVDLRQVPDDKLLACLDDMPEVFGPSADQAVWDQVCGPWLDRWARIFRGEEEA
jgi:hypothetical protein